MGIMVNYFSFWDDESLGISILDFFFLALDLETKTFSFSLGTFSAKRTKVFIRPIQRLCM